ncbi:hypothetical protein, partial [Kordia sp.]
ERLVGSEMCIRDSTLDADFSAQFEDEIILKGKNIALKVYSVERINL